MGMEFTGSTKYCSGKDVTYCKTLRSEYSDALGKDCSIAGECKGFTFPDGTINTASKCAEYELVRMQYEGE